MNFESLIDKVDKINYALENDKQIPSDCVTDDSLFIRDLLTDYIKFLKILKSNFLSLNDKRWQKNVPFSITTNVINRVGSPSRRVHVGRGFERFVIVYYGISMELENFVSIVLWPTANNKNISNITYYQIYEIIEKGKDSDRYIISMGKGFEIELPNCIHPSHSKDIKNILAQDDRYRWIQFPYIKDVGDTILSHNSPLNFKKVFLNDPSRTKSYINIRTIIGKIIFLTEQEITISVPSLYRKSFFYNCLISKTVQKKFDPLYQNKMYYFLIMETLTDKIYSTIIDVYPAKYTDLIAHLLSFSLNLIRIHEKRLKLLSISEFESLKEMINKIALKFYDGVHSHLEKSFENYQDTDVFNDYLRFYFKIVNNNIFSIPHNQIHISDNILILLDQCLWNNEPDLLQYIKKERISIPSYYYSLYDYIKFQNELKFLLFSNEYRNLVYSNLKSELFLSYNGYNYDNINNKDEIDILNKASLLLVNSKYFEALELYDQILELNPRNYYLWNIKGIILFKLKRNDEALECYNKSLDCLEFE